MSRRFPVGRMTRVALMLGALVPSMIGASVIGIMASRGLPTGAALGDPAVLRANVMASVGYSAVAVPLACGWGLRWTTVPAGSTRVVEHAVMMAIPARLTGIGAVVWIVAAVLLSAVNIGRPWLATTLGVSTMLGGVVTATLTYWWCTRVLRPFVTPVLTEHPPTVARRPGLRMRAVAAWAVGTGVPLLMVLLVAASALVVDYSGNRLAVVVLALGGAAVISGLTVTVFTSATTADPVDEVRRGLQRIGSGDYDVTVPVFDASELGLLQAGFNTMAEGLRERERLRDLFGRQVGRDVARLAEQTDTSPVMGGAVCEAGAVFVDLVGSTRMALELAPEDLVAVLNEFFGVVVEVVERRGGWINKFEGDAALAVFGVPSPSEDPAAEALAAARDLAQALASLQPRLAAGIGVSAGAVVAAYVGDPRRYEYTVIGDPVNEAARLSEYAKDHGGVAASDSALNRAAPEEAARWRVVTTHLLRGRERPTDIARPLG